MKDENEVHFEGKIAQKVILEKERKILLVQDSREERDVWELPGGRMNIDEEPRSAMQREFEEEMGCEIDVHEVVHLEQFKQGNENARAFVIVYRATLRDGGAHFSVADDEVSMFEWFSSEEIKSLELYPEYQKALDIYFANL